MADGVVGTREAPAVTELGQERGRDDRPDPVELLRQRAAAGLAARERPQPGIDRDELGVDREILLGCGMENCREDDVIELANGCICRVTPKSARSALIRIFKAAAMPAS